MTIGGDDGPAGRPAQLQGYDNRSIFDVG